MKVVFYMDVKQLVRFKQGYDSEVHDYMNPKLFKVEVDIDEVDILDRGDILIRKKRVDNSNISFKKMGEK